MLTADPQAELRQQYREQMRRQERARAALEAAGVPAWELARHLPRMDWQRFAALACGARTRAGTPCKRRDLYASGRCPLHGGLSTGPRTAAGKAAAALNGHRPKRSP